MISYTDILQELFKKLLPHNVTVRYKPEENALLVIKYENEIIGEFIGSEPLTDEFINECKKNIARYMKKVYS